MVFADYDRFRGRGERDATKWCGSDESSQSGVSTPSDTKNSTHVGHTRRSSGFFCPSMVLHGLDGPYTTHPGGHRRLPGGWRRLPAVLRGSKNASTGYDVSTPKRICSSPIRAPRIEGLEDSNNSQHSLNAIHVAALLRVYFTVAQKVRTFRSANNTILLQRPR